MRELKNAKSEQLNSDGSLSYENDRRLSQKERGNILNCIFGEAHKIVKFKNKMLDIVDFGKEKYILLISQITYLGNPHPIYKKRAQLKSWYKDVLATYGLNKDYDIRLIGIYRHNDVIVFVDFDKKSYFLRKMHNSSAHVYTNDLYQAIEHKVFTKTDYKQNVITSVSFDYFKNYLCDNVPIREDDEQKKVLSLIDEFNKSQNLFSRWISVDEAISNMHEKQFPKWKETEWAGFYLEFRYSNFILQKDIDDYIEYLNNKSTDNRIYDFDLSFPKARFFGDLKSSASSKESTMLNDSHNMLSELNKYGRLWYLIYEHETIKDKDLPGYPYSKKRLDYIRSFDSSYKLGHDDTYKQRLKAKVKYTRMFIIEINKINYLHILKTMTSNFHQPEHGKKRNPKFKLEKNVKDAILNNALIYSYIPPSDK